MKPDIQELMHKSLDITAPDVGVEVRVNSAKSILWVNVDGLCVLRICQAPLIEVNQEIKP